MHRLDAEETLAVSRNVISGYAVRAEYVRPSNSSRGVPALNVGAVVIWTAIILSPLRKNSSLPSRDHTGSVPPSIEICDRPPGPGNGWTNTSMRPGSLDV